MSTYELEKHREGGAFLTAVEQKQGKPNTKAAAIAVAFACLSVSAGVVVAAAAVVAAGMCLLTAMVITSGGFDINQRTGQQIGHTLIRVAGAAGVQLDTGLGQSHLGAGADAAADHTVHAVARQEAGQGTVTTAVGRNYLGVRQHPVHDVVNFKLLRVSEVAVDLAVFVSDSDFDVFTSFPFSRRHGPQEPPQPRQPFRGQSA